MFPQFLTFEFSKQYHYLTEIMISVQGQQGCEPLMSFSVAYTAVEKLSNMLKTKVKSQPTSHIQPVCSSYTKLLHRFQPVIPFFPRDILDLRNSLEVAPNSTLVSILCVHGK